MTNTDLAEVEAMLAMTDRIAALRARLDTADAVIGRLRSQLDAAEDAAARLHEELDALVAQLGGPALAASRALTAMTRVHS